MHRPMRAALFLGATLLVGAARAESTNWWIEVNSTGTVVSCAGRNLEGEKPTIINPSELVYRLPVTHEQWSNAIRSKLSQTVINNKLAAVKDQLADAFTAGKDEGDDVKLKAIIRALVKTINVRLPSGQKITAAELKAAIKEEL